MTTPFDNMSPEKAQFIKQIVSDAAGKNQNELLPFLLNINRQIAGKHMSFSDEETDALVSTSIFILLRIKSENLGLLTSLLITSATEPSSISSCTADRTFQNS